MATAFNRVKSVIAAARNIETVDVTDAQALEVIESCARVTDEMNQAQKSREFLQVLRQWIKKNVRVSRAQAARDAADSAAEASTDTDYTEAP